MFGITGSMAAWVLLLWLMRISLTRGEFVFLVKLGGEGRESGKRHWAEWIERAEGIQLEANAIACSIEVWALEEAKRRLQAEGTLPEDA